MFFDAAARADSPARALVLLEGTPVEPVPDWKRIAFARGLSVEVGQRFTPARPRSSWWISIPCGACRTRRPPPKAS